MRRVVPSQVVAFIDQVFPWAADSAKAKVCQLTMQNALTISGLLELMDEVPKELLPLEVQKYAEYVCCAAALRTQLDLWKTKGDDPLRRIPGLGDENPMHLIRKALISCPDQSPVAASTELAFVADCDLRNSILQDVAAIDVALSNGEWKAATVLAGSVVEALLLWSVQQRNATEIEGTVAALVAAGTIGKPKEDLEQWHLNELIHVSQQAGIIKEDTAKAALLAKNFRNLIHPGRAQRLGQKCDRATALSAVAAMEHTIRDLSRQKEVVTVT